MTMIYALYEALGLEVDAEDAALVIDSDITLYFNQAEDSLEMCCPIAPLPSDIASLQLLLRFNYASSVVVAADAENQLLLALMRFPQGCSGAELESGLQQLIAASRDLRTRISPV